MPASLEHYKKKIPSIPLDPPDDDLPSVIVAPEVAISPMTVQAVARSVHALDIPQPPKHNPIVIASVAAVIIVAIGFGSLLLRKGDDSPPEGSAAATQPSTDDGPPATASGPMERPQLAPPAPEEAPVLAPEPQALQEQAPAAAPQVVVAQAPAAVLPAPVLPVAPAPRVAAPPPQAAVAPAPVARTVPTRQVRLRLNVTPINATVRVDGAQIDVPFNAAVTSGGDHVITAEAPGHRTVTRRVNFDTDVSLNLVLPPDAPAAVARPATVRTKRARTPQPEGSGFVVENPY